MESAYAQYGHTEYHLLLAKGLCNTLDNRLVEWASFKIDSARRFDDSLEYLACYINIVI
jgi:hypothetical protein